MPTPWLESTQIQIAPHVSGFLKQKRVHPQKKTNSLEVINTLLALWEPKDLIGWLGSNTEKNSTKLIKFIVAVKDEYNVSQGCAEHTGV